jgi:hypothetical protein
MYSAVHTLEVPELPVHVPDHPFFPASAVVVPIPTSASIRVPHVVGGEISHKSTLGLPSGSSAVAREDSVLETSDGVPEVRRSGRNQEKVGAPRDLGDHVDGLANPRR